MQQKKAIYAKKM